MNRVDSAAKYGDDWADVYDAWHPFDGSALSAVHRLIDLAGGGRVLELGIGTGRLALPLHKRGIHVVGIEGSEAMLASLRSKPGGDEIPVILGNFRDLAVEGTFDLIFVAANGLFSLESQADQVSCLAQVAAHLNPGGRFVAECFVPTRYCGRGSIVDPWVVSAEETRLYVAQEDPLTQVVRGNALNLAVDGALTMRPTVLRYIWPSELDLMAQMAGLRLVHRWANWSQAVFTRDSQDHVSVYEHP